MLLVASALFLGFLHGLGADHLMAIAALSVGTTTETAAVQRTRALSVALRFACGHAVLLAVGAGALLVLGWSLPLVFERASEMIGGAVLIVPWSRRRLGRARGPRLRALTPARQRNRAPLASPRRRPDRHPLASAHSHLPTIVGAAFALSSVRALTALAPFGGRVGDMPLVTLLALIVVFGAGILLSMSLFGVALARVNVRGDRSPARSGRRAAHGADVDRAGRVLDCYGLDCYGFVGDTLWFRRAPRPKPQRILRSTCRSQTLDTFLARRRKLSPCGRLVERLCGRFGIWAKGYRGGGGGGGPHQTQKFYNPQNPPGSQTIHVLPPTLTARHPDRLRQIADRIVAGLIPHRALDRQRRCRVLRHRDRLSDPERLAVDPLCLLERREEELLGGRILNRLRPER